MTALGAALLAGIGAGQLTLSDVQAMVPQTRVFEPRMGNDQRQALWAAWRRRPIWSISSSTR